MKETFVVNFTTDGTPIPIWEVSDITGLSVDEIKSFAECIEVTYNTEEYDEHESRSSAESECDN